jgi:sugar (pentulose or hexulose) kinase
LAHQSDFINRRLIGQAVATDTSNALKTCVDLIAERWPDAVFADLGVPPEFLPPVVRAGTILGVVGPEAAKETNLPAGTPVIAGMTDGCAAKIGAGALSAGSWNSVLGTTLVLKGVSPSLIKDPAGVVYCHGRPMAIGCPAALRAPVREQSRSIFLSVIWKQWGLRQQSGDPPA